MKKTPHSISHLSAKEQNALHCIKKKIVTHGQPLLIYCWNSSVTYSLERNCFLSKKRLEDWQFSCQLLVVMPSSTAITSEFRAEIKYLTELLGRVEIVLCSLDMFRQKLSKNNLFFSWLRCSATLLYESHNALDQLPPMLSKRPEYRHEAEAYYLNDPRMHDYMEAKLQMVQEIPEPPAAESTPVQPIEIYLKINNSGSIVVR